MSQYNSYSELLSSVASICLNNLPLLLDSHMESIVPLSAFSPAKAPAMINATYTLFLRINVYIYEYPISIWQTIVAEKRKKHHREQQTLYTASNMVTMDSGSTLKCIL